MSPGRLCSALIIVLAAAIPLSETAIAARNAHSAAPRKQAAFDEHVLNAAILLARAGFSPGAIDGRRGENFAKALHAFQQVNGLPVGRLDQRTAARLAEISNTPTLAQYTIQPADVQGPFAPQIPKDFEQMAQLQRLLRRSFHQM
jgi:peptidoglycan hydrolase-like protein with peptidoglycan-binding domain